MNIYEQFLLLLDEGIKKYGSANRLAEILGVPTNRITRWKNKERAPNLTSIQPLMDLLGAKIISSDGPAKEVHFANAHFLPVTEGSEAPKDEDYIAVPLVGEVGAGPGYLPQDKITGWFMVHVNLPAIRHRRNLIAVEIGKNSTSMQPTLNPGDIVLVDREDRDASKPGRIMLVLDPLDGSGMIKRVNITPDKEDLKITYYSDNVSEYPPHAYSFNGDFGRDWDKAIAGRVIWAWSDMRER